MIHPIILSGGSGTRLWPMSRSQYPKQLLTLLSDRTLLQEAVLRVTDRSQFARPIVVAGDEHRFIVAEQLREIQVEPQAIALEAVGRNTGPACCIAALLLSEVDPEGLMLVMPSDHAIGNMAEFHSSIRIATEAALGRRMVTFGIKPDRPETGFGYIKRGKRIADNEFAFLVADFIEKPDSERANSFVESGDFFWNSGIFLFPIDLLLRELERLQPALVKACKAALANAKRDLDFLRLDAASFGEAPNLSIDYAVMEHTPHAAVVPVEMSWSDVGTWDAMWQIGPKDTDSNVNIGTVVSQDSRNCYLRSESGLLAVLGVDDLVVVTTSDAVMVTRRDRAQDVKQLVQVLKGRRELAENPLVHRPWGSYQTIHAGPRVQVKHIVVRPGGILSLQMHYHRAEHWVVVAGTAKVTRGNQELMLFENESTYIPVGMNHRLENPGKTTLHLIEVQSGSYLGEDDIVRFNDNYGRV